MYQLKFWMKVAAGFQLAAVVAIVFDVPIVRQVLGFVYLSFLPGFLAAHVLRLDLKSRPTLAIVSLGLSVAFVMFVGVAVNQILPLFGVVRPLTILPIVGTIAAILGVTTLLTLRGDGSSVSWPRTEEAVRSLVLMVVPLLAICGALYWSRFIVLAMILAVVLIVSAALFWRSLLPSQFYPVAILVIAISLLFHSELISGHLVGYDVFGEFYVFGVTKANGSWSAILPYGTSELSDYNAMLSVTILPVVYSALLNIEGEWVFKIIYLMIYAFVPLSLYQAYASRFGRTVAFLSTFYFMLLPRFYDLSSRRQMVGELFLSLLVLLMLDRSLKGRKKQIMLILFATALVLSHYSLSYVYLFWTSFSLVLVTILQKRWPTARSWRALTGGFVVLALTITFSWYLLVSPSPLWTFSGFVKHVSSSVFTDLLRPETRGEVWTAINVGYVPVLSPQFVDYVVSKLLYLFVAIGVIGLFKGFRDSEFDWAYGSMVLANGLIVAAVIVLPGVGSAFVPDRLYHVTLICLAPFCILGGSSFFGWVSKVLVRIRIVR